MRKLFFIAGGIFLISCNNEPKTATTDAVAKTPEAEVALPYKVSYDGTPRIGKSENVATVMHFNGDLIAGKMDNMSSYFADSVHVHLADGYEMNTVRDSVIADLKAWRATVASAKQNYIAAIAVDNAKNGDQWVFQWIEESHDYKNGKKENSTYHEDYRLEKGKIRECLQYAMTTVEKKK